MMSKDCLTLKMSVVSTDLREQNWWSLLDWKKKEREKLRLFTG